MLRSRLPLPDLRRGVRLACLRYAASVHPEPGSNSHKIMRFVAHIATRLRPVANRYVSSMSHIAIKQTQRIH